MTFADPVWLYATPILLMLFAGMLAYGLRKRSALLSRFAAERLLEQLTEEASRTRTWIKAICILIAAIAIGFALARPQLGIEWSERKARGLDIVFIIDSSKSMLATDLRPTRLDRAKLAVLDLVERLESDRIGLVAFAGQAFLQTPPTLDYSAFRESLDSLNPSIMTSGGSDIGYALEESAKAFPTENNVKVAVLLTDGEDLGGNALEAAKAAQEAGIQVFAIGIGTPEGEYLRIKNDEGVEEFIRDSSGQPVLSKLDESTLQEIARLTGGSYSRLSGDSLDQLYNSVIATLPREERESELQEIRIERFQWALSAALLFLVLDILIRRRRQSLATTGLIVIAAFSATPSELRAEQPATPDARTLYNQAYEALSGGDFAKATELYEASIAAGSDLRLQSDALYNLGHTHYQQGLQTYQSGDPQGALEQIKEAESLFRSAKTMNPKGESLNQDIERIGKVREAIEQLLEQQEQPEQQDQNQDSENSEQNEEQSEESQQDENSESESGEEEQKDSPENQEQQENEQGDSSENSESENQQSESSEEEQQSESGEEESSESSQSEQSEDSDDSSNSESSSTGDEESEEEQPAPGSEESEENTEEEEAPQPQAGEEENGEEGSDEQANMQEPGEEGSEDENSEAAGGQAQMIEGMSVQDATDALDQLRAKETLLPFIDQPRSGRQREIRDW